MTAAGKDSLLIIVPAYNEEGAVGGVVRAIEMALPGTPVLVIDDCSLDATQHVAREAGASVLPLPHHLGLGGCVQAGYKLAFELGYQYVIRLDGDGQHDARDIPRIFEALRSSGYEMVIGSRFVSENGSSTGAIRGLGIRFFRMVLRPILGKQVHDPTSGFVGVNRDALQVFAKSFPLEYPEIEALVVLQRRRFRFQEIPCKMHPRTTGRSSITGLRSIYYIVHVLLGVFVNMLKFDSRTRRPGRQGIHNGEDSMDRLLNVLTIASGLLVLLVLISLRRAHIRVEYSVSWLLAAAALLILSRSQRMLDAAAHMLGISYPPFVLLLVVGCVFVLMFYRYSVILSKLRDDNIALAQRLAILEYHLQSLKGDGSHA